MAFQVIGEARELLELIRRGDGNQDGFVEASADQFNLSGSNHAAEALEVFRMVLFDPQKQGTGIVDARANVWMLFQEQKECQVGVFIALLENVLEIPRRLVRVDNQDEVKRRVG